MLHIQMQGLSASKFPALRTWGLNTFAIHFFSLSYLRRPLAGIGILNSVHASALLQAPLAVQEVAVQDKAGDDEVLSDIEDSDEDMDLFGEATEEEKAARQKIIDQAKKRGEEKAKLTKSMIVLDVKPWDDTTGTMWLHSVLL